MPLPNRASSRCSGTRSEVERRAKHAERIVRTLNRIYPFLNVRRTTINGEDVPLVNVHITFKCNQKCPFCHALPLGPSAQPSTETLLESLERVARLRPGVKIAVTGGEPTLRRNLPELMSSILAIEGVRELEVQTNAVLIGRSPERFDIASAEGLRFLVAFHSSSDVTYDACTRSTGQLPFAVAGVRHLLSQNVHVELNCVVNSLNVEHLDGFIEELTVLFPPPSTPPIHFSILGMSYHRDVSPLLVRFPLMLASVERALDAASRRDVRATISLSAGHCAVPLCLLDDRMKELSEYPRMYEHEGEPRDEVIRRWWRKGDACERCVEGPCCLGLPRDYAERFGFDELKPVSR